MNAIRRGVAASQACVTRFGFSVCLVGVRYRSVIVVLPLCSSVCFFGMRFALSLIGLAN